MWLNLLSAEKEKEDQNAIDDNGDLPNSQEDDINDKTEKKDELWFHFHSI